MLEYRAEGLCRNANHLSREELSRCIAGGEVQQSTALAYDTDRRQRFEQLALPRSRPAAANIQSRRGTVFAQQEHRAPGPRCCVLCLADLEIVKGCDGDFFHGRDFFPLLFYCTSSAPAAQQKFPPGGHPAGRGIIQTRGRRNFLSVFLLLYRLFLGFF